MRHLPPFRVARALFIPIVIALISAIDIFPAAAEPAVPPLSKATKSASGASTNLSLGGEAAEAAILKLLISLGKWDEAKQVIRALPDETRSRPEVQFVEAEVLMRSGEPRRAIDVYQRMLLEDHSRSIVRLKLAKALQDVGDLGAAEYQYRLVMTDPSTPPATKKSIIATLRDIDDAKKWHVTVRGSIAPDSNFNQATDADRVQFGGQSADLSEDGQQQSGLNLTGFLGVERVSRLSANTRLRAAGFARVSDNPGTEFDDHGLGVNIGPEFRFDRSKVTLRATGEVRWIGGDFYSQSAGIRAEGQRSAGNNTVYKANISWADYNEEQFDLRDGWIAGLDTSRTYYFSPKSFWRLSGSLRRKEAERDDQSYLISRIAIAYYTHLPASMAMYLEPAFLIQDNDEPDLTFGKTRADQKFSLSGRLLKRDWSYRGFAPYLGFLVDRNESNLEIFDYSRERVELGFTRQF